MSGGAGAATLTRRLSRWDLRLGQVRLAHAVVPVAGALVTGWVLVEASRLAQLVAGGWLAVGVVALAVSRARAVPPDGDA